MSYDLDQFVSDCRAILRRDPGPAGREEVRVRLERLLANQEFVQQYCGDQVPRGLKVRMRTLTPASRSSPINDKARCRRRTTTARPGRSTARPPIGPT